MKEYNNTVFAKNLQYFMELFDLNRADIAELLGISVAAVGNYLNGKQIPRMDKVSILAKRFNVGISSLLEKDAPAPSILDAAPDFIEFPIIGSIAAGYDGMAIEEETGETIKIPKALLRGHKESDYMILQVKGDSMSPQLLDGDKVIVQRCTSVDSGSIAVIMYDGWDATIKQVRYVSGEDWLEMVPCNPAYQTKRIEGSDLEECRVLGKVVDLIRHFD